MNVPAAPSLPRLVIITPFVRDAQLWLRDNELRRRGVALVTRADMLLGMGDIEVIWLNRHRWGNSREYDRCSNYVDILRARGHVKGEMEAYT